MGEYVDTFGDDNPLADCANYEIYLNDVSMQDSLVMYLSTISGIREVHKSANVADALSSANQLIAYVSLGIIGILLAVSIFLISNTVAIGITVRREEIAIMKLIGATDFVVRSPFLFEGVLLGMIGAAIPLAAVYVIYDNLINYLIAKYSVLNDYISRRQSLSTAGKGTFCLSPILKRSLPNKYQSTRGRLKKLF